PPAKALSRFHRTFCSICRYKGEVAEIEGDSPFESGVRFAMIRLTSTSRDHHGAATSAELRILRQGSAAAFDRSAHLLLRMHVLCGLRRDQALQCVPKLRRRFCTAADP